jgi:protein-S-isoprenylcysteine O-methyltransferase Ste14
MSTETARQGGRKRKPRHSVIQPGRTCDDVRTNWLSVQRPDATVFLTSAGATIWSPLNSEVPAAGWHPDRYRRCDFGIWLGEALGTFFAEQLERIRRTKLYDLFAALPFIAWLLFCATQILPPLSEQIALASFFVFKIQPSALPLSMALNILSKVCTLVFLSALVVMFVVRRVPIGRARGLYARFAALAGTFSSVGIVWLPLHELSSMQYLISLLLIASGTAFAISAVFVLGRSISLMPEARRLITRGPYAVVRHPLYVGELIATAGLAMQFLMPWALVLFGISCVLQFERVRNEERLLIQAFPVYRDYMANTARFLPGVW